MKRLTLFLLLLTGLSCQKDKDSDIAPDAILSGTYVGTFSREIGPAYQASIIFNDGQFSGGGKPVNPPPYICRGEYKVGTGAVTFANACVFTAEFDWSLILNGEWKVTLRGDQLTMTRNADRYILTKQ